MQPENVRTIDFLKTRIALVDDEQVRHHLSLAEAIDDLRTAFTVFGRGRALNLPRQRVSWRPDADAPQEAKSPAWLHCLRAGLIDAALIGGKDYTSQEFETPAMWVTVVDARTAKPIAWLEADFLSRMRTAATTALATDVLAPPNPRRLVHFGAGKISELLVRGLLLVRPSLEEVILVRNHAEQGAPPWLAYLAVRGRLGVASEAAEAITTATNSRNPVIPAGLALPRLRHLNLVGGNHPKRREIDEDLAQRCLRGRLVVEDRDQACKEAGEFAFLSEADWRATATLGEVLAAAGEPPTPPPLTTFKSVGIGLADLAIAAGILRRLGILSANRP